MSARAIVLLLLIGSLAACESEGWTEASTDTSTARDALPAPAVDSASAPDTAAVSDTASEPGRPALAGTYELIAALDLITETPSSIRWVHAWLMDLWTGSDHSMLQLACLLEEASGEPDPDSLCALGLTETSGGDLELTAAGEAVRSWLGEKRAELGADHPFNQLIAGYDPWGHPLDELRLDGRATIAAEPDPDTGDLPADSVTIRWQSIQARWILDCPACLEDPDCGWESFTLPAEMRGVPCSPAAQVTWADPAVPDTQDVLQLSEHEVPIPYGRVSHFVLTSATLPRLFGGIPADGLPVVNSYEEMLLVMLAGRGCLNDADPVATGCAAFAAGVRSHDATLAESALTAGCERLVTEGAAYVDGLFSSLDPASPPALTMATAAQRPLLLHDHDDDGVIDTLSASESPSLWSCAFATPMGSFTLDAEVYGVRF